MALQSYPQIFCSQVATAASVTCVTVPTSYIYLVRLVRLVHQGSLSTWINISYNTGFGTQYFLASHTLKPGEYEDIWTYLPVTTGTIAIQASATSMINVIISGDVRSLA